MKSKSQYLIDYLEVLEKKFDAHYKSAKNKKYHIYRKGSFYTGTNNFKDIENIVLNSDMNLYAYKRNES